MAKILANDGISSQGKEILEAAGHEVHTDKIEQTDLSAGILLYDAIIVRSATKVTQEVIDAGANLKVIGRAGVGLDNIDVTHADAKGVAVRNTPAASSASVGELVIAHLFSMARFLQQSHREMPEKGVESFKSLKKGYSKGIELRGKTLGIVGFGRIGQETAKLAIGLGMNVVSHDRGGEDKVVSFCLAEQLGAQEITVTIPNKPLDELLGSSDFVSLHVPATGAPLIGATEIAMMKDGAGLINCARGGVVDEAALISALDSGKLAFAGVDVFEKEPTDNAKLLNHSKVSSTPHIGGSTVEAQNRIGLEMAQILVDFFAN